MSHDKFKRGSYVLLRQLDSQGNIATIWGGRVLSVTPTDLLYHWGFPRLLVQFEANDTDLEAQPVIEAAFEVHQQAQNETGEGAGA